MRRLLRLADGRWVPLVVLTIVLTAGLFLTPADLPSAGLCLIKKLFLFDCPGCGLTRAFLLLPRGHFLEAIHFNAAAPVLYSLFLLAWLEVAIPRARLQAVITWRLKTVMATLTVMILSGQWLWRLTAYFSEHPIDAYLETLGGGPRALMARAWLMQILVLL